MYLKESVASGTNHHRHHPSRNLPKNLRAPICQIHPPGIGQNLAQVLPTGFRAKAPFTFGFIPNFAQGCRTWLTFGFQLIWWILVRHPLIDWNFERNPGGFRQTTSPIRGCLTHKTNKRLTKTHELGTINPNKWGERIHQQNDLWKHLAFCV